MSRDGAGKKSFLLSWKNTEFCLVHNAVSCGGDELFPKGMAFLPPAAYMSGVGTVDGWKRQENNSPVKMTDFALQF